MTRAGAPVTVLAVDIGGTKIRAGVVDAHGRVRRALTVPTNVADGRRSILAALDSAIGEAAPGEGSAPVAIGVSTAGVVDRATGRVVDATPNLPGWKGVALGDHLRARWGLPVAVENDGKATLVAELWRRPELREGVTVLLSLGTGLGGAIAVNGAILDGAGHLAGHFGMTRGGVDAAGGVLPLEHYISGAGLARLAPPRADGRRPGSREVLEGVRRGDPDAVAARDLWVARLAEMIGDLRWMIDPHWLVLGGGVLDAREAWWPELERRLEASGAVLRPAPACCGADAGLIGAARIALEAEGVSA